MDGCTTDDLGSLYEVHRSTAARWVKDAVLELGKRDVVRAELSLSSSAYKSWARDISTGMDVSLAKYLAEDAAEPM